MNHKNKLKKFENKYLKEEQDFNYYLNEARNILSDIEYLKEHARRTKKSGYAYKITPTRENHIISFLLSKIFNNPYHYRDEDALMQTLKIIDISDNLIQEIRENIDNEINKLIDDYIVWCEVFEYFLNGIKLNNNLSSFVGCNYAMNKIKEKIQKAKDDNNDTT